MLINAGIVRIVYANHYRVDEHALQFLRHANIEIVHLPFSGQGAAPGQA
jgi:deoxycytidylate deaminase